MLGVKPLGARPLGAGYTAAASPSAFITLVQSSEAEGQYLVEIKAYKGDRIRTGGGAMLGAAPLGRRPLGSSVALGQGSAGEVDLLYSDAHWVGAPDDVVKPNAYYEGRVNVPLVMERNLPLTPETSPWVQRQFGSIEIANGDGALDSIVQSYAVDGRVVRVLYGPKMGAYRDFKTIAEVLATGWQADDLTASLLLRDRGYALDLPLQATLYEGTGDAEGTDELAGKPKPICFGRARNLTPVLIDPANLIYQVHYREIDAIDAVYDQGAGLTDSADDADDYAALVALSVTEGQYATCLAEGLFKIGATPTGLLTCDVRGDAEPDYQNTVDQIALRILQDIAGIPSSVINRGSFAGVASIAGELGFHVGPNETPTASEAMNMLIGAVGGYWGSGRDGRYVAGRLVRPENETPIFYFNQYNILELEPEETPTPRYRQRVGYQRNWTVQRGEDLAGSVTAERRQFLKEDERVVTALDTSIRVRHRQALDPAPLMSLYDSSADAQTLADYLLALHKPDRLIVRITCKRLGYLFDLGRVVNLTWPRLGLSSGRNMVIVGIREDADTDSTIIRCWG